jgi:putative ABC transport system permease protein
LIEYYSVDGNYIPAYGLKLIAGKNFTPDLSDKHEQHILLNERAVEVLKLGTPHEALGQSVLINDTLSLHVTGIVKDFNAHPFKFSITPFAFRYKPDEFNVLTVKTSPSSLPAVLKQITRSWNKLEPDYPLSYSIFADEFNERQAHTDDLKMMGSFAALAIIISCLGLLGVVMHNTQSRTKEIGVRKAMGAFTYQILVLLSWNFLKLLLIAACIAVPVGYWFGDLVLQQFAYRIELGAGIIALGFLLMMTVGLITIGSQTIRAAMRNPVDTLRHE